METTKRVRNKSKSKGNKFENQVYDEIRGLGYWIRKNKGSGNADDNKGDLETYNLLIECKHHKGVTDKQIMEWMEKIYTEATNVNKFGILIVKENYIKPIVYYIADEDGGIGSISYDDWLKFKLPMEKQPVQFMKKVEKKDIPSYIG